MFSFMNSIFSNGELGIDLSVATTPPYTDGRTLNDNGAGDSGPNNLQNFPVILVAGIDANNDLIVNYFVDSELVNSGCKYVICFIVCT